MTTEGPITSFSSLEIVDDNPDNLGSGFYTLQLSQEDINNLPEGATQEGNLIYNTTTKQLNLYNGTAWVAVYTSTNNQDGNLVVKSAAADPSSAVKGEIYFNSLDKALRVYTGRVAYSGGLEWTYLGPKPFIIGGNADYTYTLTADTRKFLNIEPGLLAYYNMSRVMVNFGVDLTKMRYTGSYESVGTFNFTGEMNFTPTNTQNVPANSPIVFEVYINYVDHTTQPIFTSATFKATTTDEYSPFTFNGCFKLHNNDVITVAVSGPADGDLTIHRMNYNFISVF